MELETKYVLESTVAAVLDNTLGAVLTSVILSAALFGILTTQCYYYALRFKRDPAWLKCIVAALWFIDGTHQITVSAVIFQYSVRHYGDFEYIPRSTWPVSFAITLEPLPAFIVQMYFARRLYHLNPKLWPIAAFTVILSVIALGTGEACAVITYSRSHFAQYKQWTWLVTIWLVTCSVCDIAVTIPVAWTLYTSRTGFKQTDVLLVRLIVWTVNTGALPASFALLEVITFIVKNETLIHLAANIVLAKLYSNTLLAFLNRRGTLTPSGPAALHFSDNIALSHVGSRGHHAQESSSEPGTRSFLSLKKNPASKKDGFDQIQVSVSTHHYYEGQPDDRDVDQKPFGNFIVLEDAET